MENESKDDGLTQEDLTILTLNQLKAALVQEKASHQTTLEQHYEMEEAHAQLAGEYEMREAELELESARLQLTVQASCNPGSPSFLVRALTELLPQHLADALQLTCCIRAGESWTLIAAHHNDLHKVVKTAGLDEAARTLRPVAPAPLLDLLPRDTARRILYTRDPEVDAGLFSGEEKGDDGSLDSLLEDSCILAASSRCLWIVAPQPRMVGRVTELAGEAAGHLTQLQPVLETASQLAMAALLQQLEAQQTQRDALVGRGATALSLHLFGHRPQRALSASAGDEGVVVGDIWAQAPAVLDALLPNASSEIFLVAPQTAAGSGPSVDAGHFAVSSSCSPTLIPPCSHEVSLLGLSLASGLPQVGGVGQPGTHLRIDLAGDSGSQTALALPLWTCAQDDPLTPGYSCVVVVRVHGPRAGAVQDASALWLGAGPLLRAWLQGPNVLHLLLNPLAPMTSPIFSTNSLSAISQSQPQNQSQIHAIAPEALCSLGSYLREFLRIGAGEDGDATSSSALSVPLVPLSEYLGLDWLVALVGSTESSAAQGGALTLLSADGSRLLKSDECSGRLRDLLSSLRQPREDAISNGLGAGLAQFRTEAELALHGSGVVGLLGPKAVHPRLLRLLPHVPASQCPVFGARLEQRPSRSMHTPGTSSSSTGCGGFSLYLIGGTVWRPRDPRTAPATLLAKLRGLGSLIQLGSEVQEAGALYSRVYQVTDRLQSDLTAMQAECSAAAQREEHEAELLQSLRTRVAELEEMHGPVNAEGSTVSGTAGGGDGQRMRRALAGALQAFVLRAYGQGQASATTDATVVSGRHVSCQLVLSETVTEGGETRRWLLHSTGDWTVLGAPGAASGGPSGTVLSMLSLAAAGGSTRQDSHAMVDRGSHRVACIYSEGWDGQSDAESPSSSPSSGHRQQRPTPLSSLEACLSVYALIGWAVVDPNTNTPVEAPSGAPSPSPPSSAVEAAWVALLSACLSKNRARVLGGAVCSSGDGGGHDWDAGEAAVRAVRAGALAGAKHPLQAYLGSRVFLEGLHCRTPGFALIPLRINGFGSDSHSDDHTTVAPETRAGVWDITALPPLSASTQSTPLPAVEQPPRRLPARLSDMVLRAAASRLPPRPGKGLPEPLPASDVLVVAGAGGSGSSLLALSGMGGCVLSHLVGSDSGVGLTLGLDSGEQQAALGSLGVTRRSLVLLYLAHASAAFDSLGPGHDAAAVVGTGAGAGAVGFLCVLRGHRLVAPCCFPQLLRLLDAAVLPLRLARAVEPLFLGVHDGAKMLFSCWPDPAAQSSAELTSQHSHASDPAILPSGDQEWARGMPERLSCAWLSCGRRDVVSGVLPRGRCVRAAAYVLSGLLPTPVSAAATYSESEPDSGSAGAARSRALLPEWRLVLTGFSEGDGPTQSTAPGSGMSTGSGSGSGSSSGSGQTNALIEHEVALAACPVPVPGAGLVQAASSTIYGGGGKDGADIQLSSGVAGSIFNASNQHTSSAPGLEVGWEDRALPPSALSSAAGSARGPARLLRLFVTIPQNWLRGLPLAGVDNNDLGNSQRSATSASAPASAAVATGFSSSSLSIGGRVVIASCLFWIEGVASPVPAGTRLALLKGGQQAGGLLGSLLLEAAQSALMAAALGIRVTTLRQRGRAQAQSLSCLRSVMLSGAKVARECCEEQDDQDEHAPSHGAPISEIPRQLDVLVQRLSDSDDRMASSRARHQRALALQAYAPSVGSAQLGATGPDELSALTSAPNADSLIEFEDQWLQHTVEATGETCSLMAVAVEKLRAERAETASLRRQVATARVSAREAARKMRSFALEAAKVLPAAGPLLELEATWRRSGGDISTQTQTQLQPQAEAEAEVSAAYLDCVLELSALTTRALGEVLDQLLRCGLREEATQALAIACSPVVHPSLISQHTNVGVGGSGNDGDGGTAVDWDARGVVVVWTDGLPPPADTPPLPELLSPDLLRAAWRRGLVVSGPALSGSGSGSGSGGSSGSSSSSSSNNNYWRPDPALTDGGQWAVEYVPYPRAEAGDSLVDREGFSRIAGAGAGAVAGAVTETGEFDEGGIAAIPTQPETSVEGYPRFVIQYLVPRPNGSLGASTSSVDGNSDCSWPVSGAGRASWAQKQRMVRAWLEDILDSLPPPAATATTSAAATVTASASAKAFQAHGPGLDLSAALALLLAQAQAPLETHGWRGFTQACAMFLSSLLRADAVLLSPQHAPHNNNSSAGVDMSGAVARFISSPSSLGPGRAVIDLSPTVLSAGQIRVIASCTRVELFAGDKQEQSQTPKQGPGFGVRVGVPALVDGSFGGGLGLGLGLGLGSGTDSRARLGSGLGPVCVSALTVTIPGTDTLPFTHWMGVVQSQRRLHSTDSQILASAGLLIQSLALSRISSAEAVGLARDLENSRWEGGLLSMELGLARMVRGGDRDDSPSASEDGERARLRLIVSRNLPALAPESLGLAGCELVRVSGQTVTEAVAWSRGTGTGSGVVATGAGSSVGAVCIRQGQAQVSVSDEALSLALAKPVLGADGCSLLIPVASFDGSIDGGVGGLVGEEDGEGSDEEDEEEGDSDDDIPDEGESEYEGLGAGDGVIQTQTKIKRTSSPRPRTRPSAAGVGPEHWAMRLSLTPNSSALPLVLALAQAPAPTSAPDAIPSSQPLLLLQALTGMAQDLARGLHLPRVLASHRNALSSTHRGAALASQVAAGARDFSRCLGLVVLGEGGGMAALSVALALSLTPASTPALDGDIISTGSGPILVARLHWLDTTHAQPQWVVSEPLQEAQTQTKVLISDVLREGRWTNKPSQSPAVARTRAQESTESEPIVIPVARNTLKGRGRGREKGRKEGGGQRAVRVWFSVSAASQPALLELVLLPGFVPRISNPSTPSAPDNSDSHSHSHSHWSVLSTLQHGVTKAISAVTKCTDLSRHSLLAERALDLARQQAAVLAACLGELCTEGRAPQGYAGPSCGFIPVMLQRLQAELGRLPGVVGSRLTCRDTVEGVELYAAYHAAPGAAVSPTTPWASSTNTPQAQSQSPEIHGRGPLHGAASSPPSGQARPPQAPTSPAPITVSVGVASTPYSLTSPPNPRAHYTFATDLPGPRVEPEHGSEFAFSCGEVSGSLVLYLLPGEAEGEVDLGALCIGKHAPDHRQSHTAMVVSLSRALARRVFELHRGYRNQQLMIRQQKNSSAIRSELAARHELELTLESAKSVALSQLQQAQEDVESLRAQLRQQKTVAAEAVAAHKSLAKQLQRVSVDLKADAAKEITETKAEAHRAEATAQAELARREAVIAVLRDDKKGGEKAKRELAVSLERERSLEKSRYELALAVSDHEANSSRQRAELEQLQSSLADFRRQIAALEADKKGGTELVALYQQEKRRADQLQAFVDMIKK